MGNSVIIVAGGKGLRMGADLPKQFLPIGGRPVLMHTLEAFQQAIPGIQIVLVLPADQQDFWRELCRRHNFTLPHRIATGGETRFHSVKNGLESLSPTPDSVTEGSSVSSNRTTEGDNVPVANAERADIVAVHDGVRPFVSSEVIRRCFEAAREHGAAIPVIPIVETVRRLSTPLAEGAEGESMTVPRSQYRLVQTPQTFQLPLLLRAYRQPYQPDFTDDASVVEALGHPVALVEGNRENIKITTPFDLVIAKALLQEADRNKPGFTC